MTYFQEIPACCKRKPTDKDIGRLAIYLKENVSSLASRLGILYGLAMADRAMQNNPDENYRRLDILVHWRGKNGSETLGDLIDLLTVTQDYQKGDLENLLERSPEKQNYGMCQKSSDFNDLNIFLTNHFKIVLYPVFYYC